MEPNESLNLDQAVEKFLAPEEPVQDDALEEVAESIVEPEEEATEVTEEFESEVESSDDDESEEYDTDEDSAEYDDEPDQNEPETITVKVDGEEVAVTLEDLKRSYSGQGKIQKGMQEAAEALKQADAMRMQLNQALQQLNEQYQQYQQTGFKRPPQEPSRELFESDPIGYMDAKLRYDEDMKSYQAEQQQFQQQQQYLARQQQEQMQQRMADEVEKLKQRIPDLADPQRAAKFRDDLVQYGSQYGYSNEELGSITDSRAIEVLADAMKWRKSQAKRTQAERKVSNARPVTKPKARVKDNPKAKQARQAKSSLKKTGSVEDALALILNG